MNAKEIGEEIARELMCENREDKEVSDDSIEKDCYLAVSELKGDIKYECCKYLEENGYVIR